MTIQDNDAFANAIIDWIGDQLDGATFDLRTLLPAGPNNAAAGTVLGSMTLPTPAMNAAASRSASKAGTWQDPVANATGALAHFRATKGSYVKEGTIGIAGATPVTVSTGTDVGSEYELVCASAHGLVVGQRVTIAGHSVAGVNGTWLVSAAPNATTFRIAFDAGANGTGGTSVAAPGDLNVNSVQANAGDIITITSCNITF